MHCSLYTCSVVVVVTSTNLSIHITCSSHCHLLVLTCSEFIVYCVSILAQKFAVHIAMGRILTHGMWLDLPAEPEIWWWEHGYKYMNMSVSIGVCWWVSKNIKPNSSFPFSVVNSWMLTDAVIFWSCDYQF